jgi:transposase
MPAKRELTMRQLRYMLRLHHDGVSAREIGRTLGVARSTIQDNLRRAQAIGIAWPVPAELTDDMLEQRLFARAGVKVGLRRRSEPDWATLARELKRPGVSLMVLWEEYRQSEPDGYGYSRFCDLFREFERRLSPVMRQHHVAGDKVFVDYSGKRIAIVDPGTGVVHDAEIFVGVLGASVTAMPRRPSRKRYPTGSAHMCGCSVSLEACRVSSCRIISRVAFTRLRSTIRRSIAAMA